MNGPKPNWDQGVSPSSLIVRRVPKGVL